MPLKGASGSVLLLLVKSYVNPSSTVHSPKIQLIGAEKGEGME